MTAVNGIDILPVKESFNDSNQDVKKNGELSPFDKLMASEVPEEDEPERNLEPAREDEPVHSRHYSAEKIAALLKIGQDEGAVESKGTLDLSLLGKIVTLDSENALPGNTLLKTALNQPGESEETLDLISRFLKGEISPEELDQLVALDEKGMGDEILFPSAASLKEGISSAEDLNGKDKSNPGEENSKDILKGFLSEDGELVYFEQNTLNKISSAKEEASAKLTIDGESNNKVQMEINVTDLRNAQKGDGEGGQELNASFQDKIDEVLNKKNHSHNADDNLSDDLLSSPGEKLISAEGSGGKLEAPVSKEVSRLFRDYMNETGNKELVRKIDFILKDANQGEIKLILKPEALGNVRINLSLNENNIAGKIFVDNSSVRDILLNNMDELTNMLKENGYDEASLEVWVGQDGNNGQEQNREGESREEKQLRSVKGLERLEESVPQTAGIDNSGSGQINLVI
jgi:flagellar hook-length control protein FliK